MIIQTPGSLDPKTAATIAAWRPRAMSEAAAGFAREVVAEAAPARPERAKALLFAAGRLAAFGESVGLELCAQALLCEASIERFIACGTAGLSPASVRTIRSRLRALTRALGAYPSPPSVPLPRDRAKAPYTPAEIEGYLRLADAQPTTARRMRASALICLGAGAGIIAGELRGVRGTDVLVRSGGVLVAVGGARARTVPVISRFQEPLLAAASFAGGRLICGGREAGRRNLSDALCRALSCDPGLPRLKAGRLRSSWLDQAAQAVGLGAFMAAAGVRCSQHLGDIASQLPALPETEMVTRAIVKCCGLAMKDDQAATLSSVVWSSWFSSSVTLMPSLNFMPSSTSVTSSWPLNRRQRSCADSSSL
jgi:integrase